MPNTRIHCTLLYEHFVYTRWQLVPQESQPLRDCWVQSIYFSFTVYISNFKILLALIYTVTDTGSNSRRVAKETSSVCGCRWRILWTQGVTFIIYDILYRNFKTQLFEILLFCSVNAGCFVEYDACYVLHFVTAIILCHTKNIYELCNCKPHRLKANFLTNTVM